MHTNPSKSGPKTMGAIVDKQVVSFRLWAPNAQAVSVVGSFNNWDPKANPMSQEDNGLWYGQVLEAKMGDQYRFDIRNGD
jgi:1,4-alpha-glucan branching enzyme